MTTRRSISAAADLPRRAGGGGGTLSMTSHDSTARWLEHGGCSWGMRDWV